MKLIKRNYISYNCNISDDYQGYVVSRTLFYFTRFNKDIQVIVKENEIIH